MTANREIEIAGKTPDEVADLIKAWREDDEQFFGEACDLLNAIETWLRTVEAK